MGQAKSGKDTLADYLVEKHGFVRIALADEIKRIMMRIYDMSEEQLWGDSKETPDTRYPIFGRGFMTPRVGMQLIGTEVVRQLYQDTWIDLGMKYARLVLEGTHYYDRTKGVLPNRRISRLFRRKPAGVAIPDIRFKNEVQGVHAEGGNIIRLKRPGLQAQVGIKGHQSEEEQKQIQDHEIDFRLDVPEGIENYHTAIAELWKRIPKGESKRWMKAVA